MRKLVLLLLAVLAVSAFAQGNGMQPVVAPDGTVLITRPVAFDNNSMASQLVAISPNGTTLWKFDAAAMMHTLAVQNARVFVAGNKGSSSMMNRSNDEEVVALALATGTVQWRRDVNGSVMGIETTADRVYVITRAGGMVSRGMMGRGMHNGLGDATLYALDAATGTVLWTLELK